ncbi:serine protease inhibitor [Lentinula aciculospora]|uniref:Serine protease inhibitor n=1 Tax=Lentinula aciculospora TaxID=153920 RepID=A0A9W9DKE4_9AGAR|nr:serine protease inhibitor [Lentinula aciculospora]
MALETGLYTIKNGDKFVGRALAEDLSLRPKKVIVTDNDSKWAIEKLGNNLDTFYTLISNGSPTAHIEHNVFALVIDRELATKWIIQHVPQHGENAHSIFGSDFEGGWTAPEEIGEQIRYRPLIFQPSVPPHYSPNGVFHIVKAQG